MQFEKIDPKSLGRVAVLMGGGIVLAIVDKNGALVLRELEEP